MDKKLSVRHAGTLSISFKPGIAQSYKAAKYMSASFQETVETSSDNMVLRQYIIDTGGMPAYHLHIWSEHSRLEQQQQGILYWLSSLMSDIETLEDAPVDLDDLQRIMQEWRTCQDAVDNFFLERFRPENVLKSRKIPHLKVGVLGGRIVMLSSLKVLYAQIEGGLFGLSIANHGSYLIEERK